MYLHLKKKEVGHVTPLCVIFVKLLICPGNQQYFIYSLIYLPTYLSTYLPSHLSTHLSVYVMTLSLLSYFCIK